jgi:hypothetical protein
MRYVLRFALLLALAAPSSAQVANPFGIAADPTDQAMIAEVATVLANWRTPDISKLDAVLAKLPRPTALRGLVQTTRAAVLGAGSDMAPAVAAIEDALRLLPDDPRPKMVATGIFTFAGSPQRAADLWMEAGRLSPEIARTSDRYVMSALIGRLNDIGDRGRADRVSARMGEIGFAAGLPNERSSAALARTREQVRANRIEDALSAVMAVTNPDDLLTLYTDRSYAMLWPRIAEWAGPDLAAQSRRYLEELKGEWTAADDFRTATPYARQLASMGAYDVVVSLFYPMFDRVRPDGEQEDAEFLAPVVARSLAFVGRDAEARALLAKIAAAMPQNDMGNALNIDGAYLSLAAVQTDWPQYVARADAFLARAQRLGSNVNRSASIQVQAWRACALSRTGRAADAQQPSAEVLLEAAITPNSAMDMLVCRGDTEGAKALVIARLADEATRGWALHVVQPERSDPATPLERLMMPVRQKVRSSPDVLAAVNRVGRILPQSVNAQLPPGFDPFRARPTPKPLGPDAV